MEQKKDIFISYKDNDEGMYFAKQLSEALEDMNYSVYFNPNEHKSSDFTEKIEVAVKNCKDFILIVSQKCLTDLMSGNEKDWVRFELLTAREQGKNIIPLMLNGVKMPSRFEDMPEALQFLPKIDNIEVLKPQQFSVSPLSELMGVIVSEKEKDDIYRDDYNNNPLYDVNNDFLKTAELAKAGDFKAMYELANMYFYGYSSENGESVRDFPKAYQWFKKLSDAECEYSSLADAMLAKMHYRGVVPREKQSFKKAFEYHKKASVESEYSKQQCAYMMSVGLGCDFDFEETEKMYLSTMGNNDNVAVSGLANFYIRYGQFKKAAELYESIIHTFPKAAYDLGCLYQIGVVSDPPKPDYFKAAFYFQHAINSGYTDADVYFHLGQLYFHGSAGFICDFKIAQQNFEKAANAGHLAAQYLVAYMYEHGHIEVDIKKAIHYHKLCADKGYILSQTHLAILYQLPEFKNYHKAFHYAQMAAKYGEKEGEFVLGNLLFFGRGCQADIDKAYEMYKLAYEHGCDQAKFMMEKVEKLIKK